MKTANCGHCGNSFRYRSNKIYCSDKCRYEAWQEGKKAGKTCVYCGLYADTIDHLPPRSVRGTLQDQGAAHRYKFLEVDCCRECNCLIGAEPPWTLNGRKKAIKKKLKKRYARYLKAPIWSDTELSKLGRNLRSEVEQGLLLKDLIEQRLKW